MGLVCATVLDAGDLVAQGFRLFGGLCQALLEVHFDLAVLRGLGLQLLVFVGEQFPEGVQLLGVFVVLGRAELVEVVDVLLLLLDPTAQRARGVLQGFLKLADFCE